MKATLLIMLGFTLGAFSTIAGITILMALSHISSYREPTKEEWRMR